MARRKAMNTFGCSERVADGKESESEFQLHRNQGRQVSPRQEAKVFARRAPCQTGDAREQVRQGLEKRQANEAVGQARILSRPKKVLSDLAGL